MFSPSFPRPDIHGFPQIFHDCSLTLRLHAGPSMLFVRKQNTVTDPQTTGNNGKDTRTQLSISGYILIAHNQSRDRAMEFLLSPPPGIIYEHTMRIPCPAWFFAILLFTVGTVSGTPPEPALFLVTSARSQIGVTVSYDPEYRSISYPNGDVPQSTGVCTDVVIRAMRRLGFDLQKEVHEDMSRNFSQYPKLWGLKSTDKNIDHRRVPNRRTFMYRRGWAIPLSPKSSGKQDPGRYHPGDVVTWLLPGNLPHIGIVSDRKSPEGIPLIIHNIGAGTQEENCLFSFSITGHFRPKWSKTTTSTHTYHG